MKVGILVCGLNGVGKSTLAQALAAELDWCFVDAEDLYFPEKDEVSPYAQPCTFEQVQARLKEVMAENDRVVLASVKGNYGQELIGRFSHVVYITVPQEIRKRRLKERSYRKFGSHMRPGEDLYEQEKAFLDFAMARDEQTVENWLTTLSCPVIRIDGTLPIQSNVELLCAELTAK